MTFVREFEFKLHHILLAPIILGMETRRLANYTVAAGKAFHTILAAKTGWDWDISEATRSVVLLLTAMFSDYLVAGFDLPPSLACNEERESVSIDTIPLVSMLLTFVTKVREKNGEWQWYDTSRRHYYSVF